MPLKRALLALALVHSFWILTQRWGYPLASPHAFRETQTAISVYLHASRRAFLAVLDTRFRTTVDDHVRVPNVSTYRYSSNTCLKS